MNIMKSLKVFFAIILGILSLISTASATLISFEGGPTLADNDLTLTQGIVSRATIQSSVTSNGTTLLPTSGSTHVLKLSGGADGDIINPAYPNDLTTLVTFNHPVTIDKPFLLMDFAFMNRDAEPANDRQRVGINGMIYDVTGSAETGWHAPFTLGWKTLAISFTSTGSIDLALGCVNDTFNASSSYCVWDNFRTVDAIPTISENNGIPVFSSPGIPSINLGPTTPIPEPGSLALLLLGLMGIGVANDVIARRRVTIN